MTGLLRALSRPLLRVVDIVYHWRHKSEPVGPMLLVNAAIHDGPDKQFADGTLVKHGDVICAFHFDNRVTANLTSRSSRAAALEFKRLLVESFTALARKSIEEPGYAQYAAYCGITWMPPHGAKLGFETEPLPEGDRKRFLMRFFRILVWIVAPAKDTRGSARFEPTAFWMTRKTLHSLYLDDADEARG